MEKFPEKFVQLHQGEEIVRSKNIELIEQSSDYTLHIQIIEKATDLVHFLIHRDEHRDQNDLAVRLLGIRLFNGLNASLKLLLSGYYQKSAMVQRDLVETFFLLDYFSGDTSLIERWRTADEKTLREYFSPAAVRKALDTRGDFKGKKREEQYKLMSKIASHPNPHGFEMLKLPTGEHHCGPFMEEKALAATLAELGKCAVQIGSIFAPLFDHKTKADQEKKLDFLEKQHEWCKRFFGHDPFDPEILKNMRENLSKSS